MPAYTQEDRRLSIETPLGPDELLLTAIDGKEEISRLYSFDLQLLSENPSIDAKEIVGSKVSVAVRLPDDTVRYFSGHVTQFAAHGTDDRLSSYSAEIKPWLWFLTQKSDCRVFQNKTVSDILQTIFGELGFADFELSGIKGNHPSWEYCIQYRESDFNFISRLMEQEGIFYYFRHEKDKHVLVFADQAQGYAECVENEVRFASTHSEPNPNDNILSWEHRLSFRTGKVAHTDYNYQKPTSTLMTKMTTVMQTAGVNDYEIYDYPGEYEIKSDGDSDVKIRMEEIESFHDVVSGKSHCRTFSPGHCFTVDKHHVDSENGKSYVLTSVHHRVSQPGSYTTGRSGAGAEYVNSFEAIPDSTTFRPQRITAKPSISGIQTARVTGPAGEEIYTDKFGRIKVQFHWDRLGTMDDASSCWVRVAQPSAGAGWGAFFWPRIGHEVVVQFLEGDPDRPLVIGCVYNGDNAEPYGLPGMQTQSGIKSHSSPGGGASDFNELRFEDKKGQELVHMQAQKDRTVLVKHNNSEKIGNAESLTVGGARTKSVGTNETITIALTRTTSIGVNDMLNVGAAQEISVGATQQFSCGGWQSLNVGAAQTLNVADKQSVSVGKDAEESVGENKKSDVTKKYEITVGDEFKLTCGQASINLKKDGTVEIKGMKLTINGSVIDIGSSAGPITIKGPMVKIN